MANSQMPIADKLMDRIEGSYNVYGVGSDGSMASHIHAISTSCCFVERKELRAYRQARRQSGKSVADLGEEKLADELLVVFGPEMSARNAIAALEKLVNEIKSHGLQIGKPRPNRDVYHSEFPDGTIVDW
jgi:hypothetical protein